MSINEYITTCRQYKELQRMREEIDAELAALADEIKKAMGDIDTVTAGEYKITNKTVNSSRLDTTALKKELPEIAARFTVSTVQTRFQIR